MKKKIIQRIQRRGKVSLAQLLRDQEVRRKVMVEFPPARPESLSGPLSVSLKKAISNSRKTVLQLAKEAGVSRIIVSGFIAGERDIHLGTADKLARVLGLKLVGK